MVSEGQACKGLVCLFLVLLAKDVIVKYYSLEMPWKHYCLTVLNARHITLRRQQGQISLKPAEELQQSGSWGKRIMSSRPAWATKKAPVFKRPNSTTNKTYRGSSSSASLALGVDWYSLVFQKSVLLISASITPWPSASHRYVRCPPLLLFLCPDFSVCNDTSCI